MYVQLPFVASARSCLSVLLDAAGFLNKNYASDSTCRRGWHLAGVLCNPHCDWVKAVANVLLPLLNHLWLPGISIGVEVTSTICPLSFSCSCWASTSLNLTLAASSATPLFCCFSVRTCTVSETLLEQESHTDSCGSKRVQDNIDFRVVEHIFDAQKTCADNLRSKNDATKGANIECFWYTEVLTNMNRLHTHSS